MKKIFQTTLCLCTCTLMLAQNSFVIHGKVDRLSKSDTIRLSGSYGTFASKINDDGSFTIKGEGIKMPGFALINTDSSGANSIWLVPGEYHIEFKETRMAGVSSIIFRIPKLIGPSDAEIYQGYHEKFFDFNYVPREQRKQVARDFVIQYIDSIYKNYPTSLVLPDLLRSSVSLMDDGAIQEYYSLLSEEQIAQPEAKNLNNYYQRKNKIETEKIFQNFTMPRENNELFELSSVKGKKLVLIDLWASWCAPCRRNHQRLIDLYKKYAERGLEIISISLDDNKNDWLTAIKKDNMTWINVSELKGWQTSVAKNYFTPSLPYAFLLDKDRRIISYDRAFTDEQIEKYLNAQ